jgi:hypothetical protein
MPLPAAEPVDIADVQAIPSIGNDLDAGGSARLVRIVAAVNAFIRTIPAADRVNADTQEEADLLTWPGHIVEGGVMLAARLWRRKDTPAGVVSSPTGPVYVRRNDPDIALLLELGEHGRPAVG